MKRTTRVAWKPILFVFLTAFAASAASDIYEPMPGPGKKVQIGKNHTAMYSFDKKPQMGMVVMNLEVFDQEGKKDSSLTITGDLDMPSMKGAHGTGPKPLQLNKKGDYLMALHLMMPGEWEIQLVFMKEKTVIYRGSIRFRV
jgi:nitrogen fixation protein FixH